MMGSLKGQLRVVYGRTGQLPTRLTGTFEDGGAEIMSIELTGKYYRVEDRVYDLGNGKAALKALPVTSDEQWGWVVFKLDGGDGEFGWSSKHGGAPDAPKQLQQEQE